MTKEKHTQLPWTYRETAIRKMTNANHVILDGNGKVIADIASQAQETEANAAFIVEACNAYDPLKAQCKRLIHRSQTLEKERDALREAIKQTIETDGWHPILSKALALGKDGE
jgi:predicted transcriptional regulator